MFSALAKNFLYQPPSPKKAKRKKLLLRPGTLNQTNSHPKTFSLQPKNFLYLHQKINPFWARLNKTIFYQEKISYTDPKNRFFTFEEKNFFYFPQKNLLCLSEKTIPNERNFLELPKNFLR